MMILNARKMQWNELYHFIYEGEKVRSLSLAKEEIWQNIPKPFKNVKLCLTSSKLSYRNNSNVFCIERWYA